MASVGLFFSFVALACSILMVIINLHESKTWAIIGALMIGLNSFVIVSNISNQIKTQAPTSTVIIVQEKPNATP